MIFSNNHGHLDILEKSIHTIYPDWYPPGKLTYPQKNGTFESMMFQTSRLVGYVSIPWRVDLIYTQSKIHIDPTGDSESHLDGPGLEVVSPRFRGATVWGPNFVYNGLVRLNRFGGWVEALYTYIYIYRYVCVVLNVCWINDEDHWMYKPLLKKHMSVSGMK